MDNSKYQRKIILKVPFIVFLILGIPFMILLSDKVANYQRERDKADFSNQLEDIFNGKSSVCSYKILMPEGKFYEVSREMTMLGDAVTIVQPDGYLRTLAFEPGQFSGGSALEESYRFSVNEWNSLRNISHYYEPSIISYSELTINRRIFELSLHKRSDFEFITKHYGSIGYYPKHPHHFNVEAIYRECMQSFVDNNTNDCYNSESQKKIERFESISNNTYSLLKDIMNTRQHGYLNKGSSIIRIFSSGNYYNIVENSETFRLRRLYYSILSSFLFIALSILTKYRKRFAIRIT